MNTKLFETIKNNDFERVKVLISSGYDVNTEDDYYRTPLMYASENGCLNIVKYLLDNGADVNIKDYHYKKHS